MIFDTSNKQQKQTRSQGLILIICTQCVPISIKAKFTELTFFFRDEKEQEIKSYDEVRRNS